MCKMLMKLTPDVISDIYPHLLIFCNDCQWDADEE
jgi:hypothetical protein